MQVRVCTGRSRNDQVITDTRLYAKELCRELMGANLKLRKTLLALAAQNEEVLLPGYTHLQHAQPVLLAHHFMAYYWMFTRDFNRLRQAFDAADMNPLVRRRSQAPPILSTVMRPPEHLGSLRLSRIRSMPFPIVISCSISITRQV